jgi:hypothetical protein
MVCLITLHAYASWMPDRPEGSFHWKRGYQPPSEKLAAVYRNNQAEPEAVFCEHAQRLIIDETLRAAYHQRFTVHAIGTDSSHFHCLAAWADGRRGDQVRRSLKHSLTRVLNDNIERRLWFSHGGDVNQVFEPSHFNYLRDVYVPSHAGLKWSQQLGVYARVPERSG